jgi:hypothetical protein
MSNAIDYANFGPIVEMLASTDRVAMFLSDEFLTPTAWNATADAMYFFSRYSDRVKRNPLVRIEDATVIRFYGDRYEEYARNTVEGFRRAYLAREPPSYARSVYTLANKFSIVRKYADEPLPTEAAPRSTQRTIQHHPIVGTFSIFAIDLLVPDQLTTLRIVSPADEASRVKFELLRELRGRPA